MLDYWFGYPGLHAEFSGVVITEDCVKISLISSMILKGV